jgi:hypothetical protein
MEIEHPIEFRGVFFLPLPLFLFFGPWLFLSIISGRYDDPQSVKLIGLFLGFVFCVTLSSFYVPSTLVISSKGVTLKNPTRQRFHWFSASWQEIKQVDIYWEKPVDLRSKARVTITTDRLFQRTLRLESGPDFNMVDVGRLATIFCRAGPNYNPEIWINDETGLGDRT